MTSAIFSSIIGNLVNWLWKWNSTAGAPFCLITKQVFIRRKYLSKKTFLWTKPYKLHLSLSSTNQLGAPGASFIESKLGFVPREVGKFRSIYLRRDTPGAYTSYHGLQVGSQVQQKSFSKEATTSLRIRSTNDGTSLNHHIAPTKLRHLTISFITHCQVNYGAVT